jgi:hypothetical protein
MESQLRDLLDAAVGDPPRRVTVERVRRRVARRRKLECVTSAAVVVVLLALGIAAFARDPSGHSAADAGLPAGIPRYYVADQNGPATLVRSTATGAVTGTVPAPRLAAAGCMVAGSGHQTFFLACATRHYALGMPYAVQIYRFQVTATGQVTGYSVIPGGVLHGPFLINSFAASADGSEVAVSLLGDGPSWYGQKIVVINTATGARAVWHAPENVRGKVYLVIDAADEMSFTGDGRELVFVADPECIRSKDSPPCQPSTGTEVLALSPANRGGDVTSGRVLLRQSSIMRPSGGSIQEAVISPDGATLTLLIQRNATHGQPATESVVQYSAVTGKKVHILYGRHGRILSAPTLSSDPSGRYFLLNLGAYDGVNGWIDRGRLVRLPPATGILWYEAW